MGGGKNSGKDVQVLEKESIWDQVAGSVLSWELQANRKGLRKGLPGAANQAIAVLETA